MIIAAVVLGIIVGVLLGVVGGGGSILAVPALVYGVGLPLDQAIPTSLIVVGTASAVAVLPRLRGGVKRRLALIVGSSGIVTAFAGAAVNEFLDTHFLLLLFAAIMVVAGIRMLLRQRVGDGPIPVRMGERSGAAACREPSARAQSSGSSLVFSGSAVAFSSSRSPSREGPYWPHLSPAAPVHLFPTWPSSVRSRFLSSSWPSSSP